MLSTDVPDPEAAFTEAVRERSRWMADPKPGDLPALAMLAHYDQQAACAKVHMRARQVALAAVAEPELLST